VLPRDRYPKVLFTKAPAIENSFQVLKKIARSEECLDSGECRSNLVAQSSKWRVVVLWNCVQNEKDFSTPCHFDDLHFWV